MEKKNFFSTCTDISKFNHCIKQKADRALENSFGKGG